MTGRCARGPGPQLAAQVQSIAVGQADVQDQQFGRRRGAQPLAGLGQPGAVLDLKALAAQREGDRVGYCRVVFQQQDQACQPWVNATTSSAITLN